MIKTKAILIVAVVTFVVGLSMGSGLMYKWAMAQESGRLKVALEIKEQEREAALASLKKYYEDKPPIEVIKTEVEYVIKNTPYSRDCDVSPNEQRMLDYSRTGVRITTRRPNESPAGAEASGPVERLPRAAEVRAHADAAINYRQCYAAAKAVELYLKSRATPL